MYPSLQVGPISLPTAQILALVAAWFGLSVMAQVGRRLRLDPDMVWNLGTLALAAGLIVARLSHAVQYWSVYRAEPMLLISIRPGGLLFWPGAIGALAAGYIYLVRKGVDPRPVGTAAVFGLLAGGVVLEASNFLTAATVGVPGTPPAAISSALTGIGKLAEPLRLIIGRGPPSGRTLPGDRHDADCRRLSVVGQLETAGTAGGPGAAGAGAVAAFCGRICG